MANPSKSPKRLFRCTLSRLDHVLGENRRRYSAHATRHGSNCANNRLRSIKIDVADQLAGGLVPVNAHIDDRLALANRIRANRARSSNRGNTRRASMPTFSQRLRAPRS